MSGASRSFSLSADRAAEELVRPHRCPALLALDEERRGEPRAARRTEVPDLTLAARACGRDLGLELDEVAEREAAVDAERDPVTERLATLLLDPVSPGPLARFHASERR